MTVEAREPYIVVRRDRCYPGSRTPFRANAHRARAERSIWRQIDAADGGVGRGIPANLKGSRGEKACRCVGSGKILADFRLRHYPKCRQPTTPKRDVKRARTILPVAAAQTALTAFSDEIHDFRRIS